MRSVRRRDVLVCLAGLAVDGCSARGLAPDAADVPYGAHEAQKFDLYKPKKAKGCGVVILIHGGGWHQGSRRDTLGLVPGFLAQNYVVANFGYRLLGDAPAPAAAEDVRYGVAEVIRKTTSYVVGAQRVALVGFSAGAHLALLAVTGPPERVGGPQCDASAVVSFWGITDVADLASGANTRDFASRWVRGGGTNNQLARDLSPLTYEPPANTALLAFHSIYDPVVPFAHSERLVARWAAADNRAELVRLEYPDHGADSEQFQPLLRRTNSFLATAMTCREAA